MPERSTTLGAALSLLRIARTLTGDLDSRSTAAVGHGIAESEILVRTVAAPGGRVSMSELAEKSGFTQSGLCRIVDRLEARDLVRRIPDLRDRRQLLIRVTTSGFDVARQLLGILEVGSRRVLERQDFAGLLTLVTSQLASQNQQGPVAPLSQPRADPGGPRVVCGQEQRRRRTTASGNP